MNSQSKLDFLNDLGISLSSIPYTFLEQCHSYSNDVNELEYWFNDKDHLSFIGMQKVCIKDIVGTNHPGYQNKSWIDAFLDSKRGCEIIDLLKKHPSYYFEDLKQKKQSSLIHDTPLEVFQIDNKYYIKGGNNRILLLKMLYLSELKNSESDLEKKLLDEKYSFYMNTNKVPETRIVISIIYFLESCGIKFNRIDEKEYHYNIVYNNKNYITNSFEDLKQLFVNVLSFDNIDTNDKLYEHITNLVKLYISLIPRLHLKDLFLEIFPNFETLKNYFIKLRNNASNENIFNDFEINNISYDNIFSYIENIALKEEKEDFENLFHNYQNETDLYEKIINHKYTKIMLKKDKKLQEFLIAFNKNLNYLDFSNKPNNYEDFFKLLMQKELKLQYEELLPELALEKKLKNDIFEYNKIRTILEHKDELKELCDNYKIYKDKSLQYENYIKIEANNSYEKENIIEGKKTTINNIKQKKGLSKVFHKKEKRILEQELIDILKEKKNYDDNILTLENELNTCQIKIDNILKEIKTLLSSDITISYIENILQNEKLTLPFVYKQINDIQTTLIENKTTTKIKAIEDKALEYGITLDYENNYSTENKI
jgi:hypothetical protein